VELFDGCGLGVGGSVARVGRNEVVISVEGRFEAVRPRGTLTLVQAWLNHEKANHEIIHRGTELGVDRFCFFHGERSERKPLENEKWARYAVESCKQCGRLWLPEFSVAEDIVEGMAVAGARVLVCTPGRDAVSFREGLGDADEVGVVIGPEGGLSDGEVERALERGGVVVSLGSYTLRSEVAAAAACVLAQEAMGRLG